MTNSYECEPSREELSHTPASTEYFVRDHCSCPSAQSGRAPQSSVAKVRLVAH